MIPPAIRHPLLDLPHIRHGFFSRQGGVSQAPYNSLNIGLGSKDDPDHVLENRRRVASAFGQAPERLLSLYQIHSATAHIVTGPWADPQARPEGDGLVTQTPDLIVSALSADCAPLLWADPKAGLVAACHAGWKGALYGIIESTIDSLIEQGATKPNLRCVIGPSIAQASYEVSQGFYEEFMHNDSEAKPFFIKGQALDKYHFDLPHYCLMRLQRSGLSQIAATGHDTCAQPELFFSNRRAYKTGESDYGRLISAIMMSS